MDIPTGFLLQVAGLANPDEAVTVAELQGCGVSQPQRWMPRCSLVIATPVAAPVIIGTVLAEGG